MIVRDLLQHIDSTIMQNSDQTAPPDQQAIINNLKMLRAILEITPEDELVSDWHVNKIYAYAAITSSMAIASAAAGRTALQVIMAMGDLMKAATQNTYCLNLSEDIINRLPAHIRAIVNSPLLHTIATSSDMTTKYGKPTRIIKLQSRHNK